MTDTTPPLPPGLNLPLPRHLRWKEVIAIFAHWNVGGKRYLTLLVETRVINPVARKGCSHGRLYPTHEVLSIWPE